LPKLFALLAGGQRETGLAVNVTRGGENAVGPERNAAIAALPREPDAFISQPGARGPRPRAIGSTSSRRSRATFSESSPKNTEPTFSAVQFGDPAPLAGGVELGGEVGDDLGTHTFEIFPPSPYSSA